MIKVELNVCPNYKSCLAQRVTLLENDASPDCINCDLHRSYSLGFSEGVKQAVDAMTKERPQGKWIEETVPVALVGRGNGQYRCSNCQHGDVHAKTQEVPFCWYCGAKMDGKEVDNDK